MRSPRRLVRWAIIIGILAGPGCVSCGSGVEEPGPIGLAGNPSTVCTPMTMGQQVSFGSMTFRDPGKLPLTVDGIDLINPGGLEIVGTMVIPNRARPDGSSLGVGVVKDFPPSHDPASTLEWDKARPLDGIVIPSGGPEVPWDLVVGLRGTEPISGANGVIITYHDENQKYQISLPSRWFLVDPKFADCSDIPPRDDI